MISARGWVWPRFTLRRDARQDRDDAVRVEAAHGREHDRAGAVGDLDVAEFESLEDGLTEGWARSTGITGTVAVSLSSGLARSTVLNR